MTSKPDINYVVMLMRMTGLLVIEVAAVQRLISFGYNLKADYNLSQRTNSSSWTLLGLLLLPLCGTQCLQSIPNTNLC